MEQKPLQMDMLVILVDIINYTLVGSCMNSFNYFMYVYMHACAFHAVNYINWFMCIIHVMTTFY